MASLPSPREPFLDHRVQAVLNQRGKELLGMALVGLGLVMALILGSYSPTDPGWMAATDEPVRNALGRFGASIAAPLVIIAGKGGWGLALALVVWGARLIAHQGAGTILARTIFVPIAVALSTVWLASLVPGDAWQHDFGLGGMFGDTVLGAMLTALPISSTAGFNVLTLVLFGAMLAMWLYVLGTTGREILVAGAFLVAGVILGYAAVASLLTSGLRGTLRGVGGGLVRLQDGMADRRARLSSERAQAQAYQAHLYQAQAYPAQAYPNQTIPPQAHHGAIQMAPQAPGFGHRVAAPPAPGFGPAGPAMATNRVPHAQAMDPGADWQPAATAGPRVARVVRPETMGPGAAPMPQPHRGPASDPADWQGYQSPFEDTDEGPHPVRHHPHAAPGHLAATRHPHPAATLPGPGGAPPLSAPTLRVPQPAWGQPTRSTGLLARVSALGRRLSDPLSVEAQGAVPELHEPRLSAAAHAAEAPAPDRVRSRIGDLVRARNRAKPVLRFDADLPPDLPRPPPPGLRPEPALVGGARAPAPAQLAPAPAAPTGGFASGLFGLTHSFGWTASAVPAALAPAQDLSPAPVSVPGRPGGPLSDRVSGPVAGPVSGPAPGLMRGSSLSQAAPVPTADDLIDDEGELPDPDLYGAPPARTSGVYSRRVVQSAPRKAPVPSTRARAEAQPLLPFEDRHPAYELPPLSLLSDPIKVERYTLSDEALEENARMLESVLDDYGVRGEIVAVRPGPVVTLYELEPAPGLKASRVIGLSDDIARSMSALSARVSTVPGRTVIGIELPNARREKVLLREILGSRDFGDSNLRLPLALGKDIGGEPIVANLAKMPHLLIAGTTGSGKSVAINTMILSLLYKLTPAECRLIMIDPKMLELSVYDGIPHLLSPVVTDPKKAVVALKWVVGEMEERYRRMSKMGVRNIDGYNGRVREAEARGEMFKRTIQTGFDDETGDPVFETEEFLPELLPFIVVVVDEMADLMMVAGKEIEACIQRLAQMARASGIHLIMATQRPSVDVITGTIKANFPTRISFQVTSKIDSRTILGEQGAEQLLGMGDMLYMAGGSRITRIHGPFVSDEEVEEVVTHLKSFGPANYVSGVLEAPEGERESEIDAVLGLGDGSSDDALYDQAVAIVARDRKCSTSYIQRKLGIGYNKAARLVEQMETEGVVSRANQVGKREILVPEA